MRVAFLGVALFLIPVFAFGQDNARLAALKNADQAPRQTTSSGAPAKVDWKELSRKDAERRQLVLGMLMANEVKTATDFYNAAQIFQHGQTPEAFRLAHALATVSTTLDPAMTQAQWLKAASWDRLVQNLKQPQWYGTQYVRDSKGQWVLYPVLEGAVTDSQRAELGVPALEQARARAEQMNSGR